TALVLEPDLGARPLPTRDDASHPPANPGSARWGPKGFRTDLRGTRLRTARVGVSRGPGLGRAWCEPRLQPGERARRPQAGARDRSAADRRRPSSAAGAALVHLGTSGHRGTRAPP